MRGLDERSGSLFSYVDLEARVRRDHPLRPIREIANAALLDLSKDFARGFANHGHVDAGLSLECGLQGSTMGFLGTAQDAEASFSSSRRRQRWRLQPLSRPRPLGRTHPRRTARWATNGRR